MDYLKATGIVAAIFVYSFLMAKMLAAAGL